MITIESLKELKESEDKVEFKEASAGTYSFNGGTKSTPKERRHCIVGYVIAFANEGGGHLVFGMHNQHPHSVVGTTQSLNSTGKLEQDIYRETRIRVNVLELFDEDKKRVLVISVPSRPIGKAYKFEDVPLMRVGEELLPMSDEKLLTIIQEQEPDFSKTICERAVFSDLDPMAIQRLKEAYAKKQENVQFLTLPDEQALNDLHLLEDGKVTYAGLILVGKEDSLKLHLPQSQICLEYRGSTSQIVFDSRQVFSGSYFLVSDTLWNAINQRNGRVPVQQGPFIFDIPFFNQEVIREALNNAVAHRDYRKSSEVVIKQFPHQLNILSPGGFPLGVTFQNLLTVNSTPRNRLLSDVLAKTGAVERSGQGIDKIFYQSLSEAKPEPDYSKSDDFQVELRLSGLVEDKAFALFIHKIQADRKKDEKLGVQEIIALNRIRRGDNKRQLDLSVVTRLEKDGLVERIGRTNSQKFILSKQYFIFIDDPTAYSSEKALSSEHILLLIIRHLQEFGHAKMGAFESSLKSFLTRDQVKYFVGQLVRAGTLDKEGRGKGTVYRLGKKMEEQEKIAFRAFELGVEEMKKRGEIFNK